MNTSTFKSLSIALSLLSCTPQFCKPAPQETQESPAHYSLMQELGIAYLTAFGLTLTHELGHALMANIINGTPLRIVVGRQLDSDSVVMGHPGISICGLNPFVGFCAYWRADTPYKTIAIAAAGPLAGLLAGFYAYKWVRKKMPHCDLMKFVLMHDFYLNLLQFTPHYTDGMKIAESINTLLDGQSTYTV
jgi:hypothetical protein